MTTTASIEDRTDLWLTIPTGGRDQYPHTGHICGYCYILNVETGLMPDEGYRWWFGDNDLYLRAKKFGGAVGVLTKVRHLHGNELTSTNPKLLALTEEDKKLFYSRLDADYYV
jgi:hypothetical protein